MPVNPPLISVVMPVYNGEAFLAETLDSLLRQTYKNFELLAVDDGSSDGSHALLEEFRKKDGRIKVFSQKNAGAGAARNRGLQESAGAWVTFLDCDDLLMPAMLESLYESVSRSEADTAEGGISFFRVLPSSEKKDADANKHRRLRETEVFLPPRGTFSSEEALRRLLERKLYPAVWNKLYRKELFTRNGIRFPGTALSEDLFLNLRLFRAARRVVTVDQKLYGYRQHAESVTRNFRPEFWLPLYRGWEEAGGFLQEEGVFSASPEIRRAFNGTRLVNFTESYKVARRSCRKDFLRKMRREIRNTLADSALSRRDRLKRFLFGCHPWCLFAVMELWKACARGKAFLLRRLRPSSKSRNDRNHKYGSET